MKLGGWKQQFEPKILRRGEDYYVEGAVQPLNWDGERRTMTAGAWQRTVLNSSCLAPPGRNRNFRKRSFCTGNWTCWTSRLPKQKTTAIVWAAQSNAPETFIQWADRQAEFQPCRERSESKE